MIRRLLLRLLPSHTELPLREAMIVILALAVGLAVGWSAPVSSGDLRPSPDAVEYGLLAAALARGERPVLRAGGLEAPPRYPLGHPLLAAPLVKLAAAWRGSRPQPDDAVLASLLAGIMTLAATGLAARRIFGTGAAILTLLLVAASPFYAAYTRAVMAEMPSAALLAVMAALLASMAARPAAPVPEPEGAPSSRHAGGASGTRPSTSAGEPAGPAGLLKRLWPRAGHPGRSFALGLLLAGAVWMRLANVQAAPALALGVWLAAGRGRPARGALAALAALAAGTALGLLPLAAEQWLAYGSPLRTGYHLWTPEWTSGERPAFSPVYALARPALPASAAQPNLVHYGAAWLGLPARGDGGQPVSSPVHPFAAGAIAILAVIGAWRAFARPKCRAAPDSAVAAFVVAGLGSALVVYGFYFYQDARFLAPWSPLWLLLAAGGVTSLSRLPGAGSVTSLSRLIGWASRAAALGLVLALLVPLWPAVTGAPLWQQVTGRQRAVVPPRLAQLQALARETGPRAWIISAIDGPLVDEYVVRGTARRYIPLACGLEFVDKPPFAAVRTAEELHDEIAARISTPPAEERPAALTMPAEAPVVIDRWSLELAEGLPDYRAALERALAGIDLLPGGAGAPRQPSFYVLVPAGPDHGLAAYDLREGDLLRGSGEPVYLYEEGRRRHVASLQSFTAHGWRWEDVRRLPDRVLEAIPEGRPLE